MTATDEPRVAQQIVEDGLDPWRAQALAGALGLDVSPPGAGDELLPTWHWVYFLEAPPHDRLAPDGHPKRGDFLPDVKLPSRMWAAGSLRVGDPPRLGQSTRRVSEVASMVEKPGRTGPLVFVTVRHRIEHAAGVGIEEEQVLVYREPPPPGAPLRKGPEAPGGADWRRGWRADERMLFRYSALIYNAHRIHYDSDYCRDVEGYPGLVVHGPLLASALVELARSVGRERGRRIAGFEYRAEAPVFHVEEFAACARSEEDGLSLWIEGEEGDLRMRGRVRWAEAG